MAQGTVEDLTRQAIARTEVRNVVAELIGRFAPLKDIPNVEDARLDNELLMESLKFVELQVAIEDEFDIELDPIHIVELNRLGDIIDYIHDCIQAKRP